MENDTILEVRPPPQRQLHLHLRLRAPASSSLHPTLPPAFLTPHPSPTFAYLTRLQVIFFTLFGVSFSLLLYARIYARRPNHHDRLTLHENVSRNEASGPRRSKHARSRPNSLAPDIEQTDPSNPLRQAVRATDRVMEIDREQREGSHSSAALAYCPLLITYLQYPRWYPQVHSRRATDPPYAHLPTTYDHRQGKCTPRWKMRKRGWRERRPCWRRPSRGSTCSRGWRRRQKQVRKRYRALIGGVLFYQRRYQTFVSVEDRVRTFLLLPLPLPIPLRGSLAFSPFLNSVEFVSHHK